MKALVLFGRQDVNNARNDLVIPPDPDGRVFQMVSAFVPLAALGALSPSVALNLAIIDRAGNIRWRAEAGVATAAGVTETFCWGARDSTGSPATPGVRSLGGAFPAWVSEGETIRAFWPSILVDDIVPTLIVTLYVPDCHKA